MTQEQKAQLLLAIERAEAPGECRYTLGCVIAQLADIVDHSGHTRRALSLYDSQPVDSHINDGRAEILRQFGPTTLRAIQVYWDGGIDDPDSARRNMREAVEAA